MADKTDIEWTDATWNPITGCQLKSPGCKICYAMKPMRRRRKSETGRTLDGRIHDEYPQVRR